MSSVVGFDLGNLNCVIAIARNRGIDIVANEVSNRATPSLVGFQPSSGQRLIGEPAKTMEISNLKNTCHSIKRLIERDLSACQSEFDFISCDITDDGKVKVDYAATSNQTSKANFSYTQLMAMLLTKLKQTAEADLGGNQQVCDVVLSIPVYYTEQQRRSLIAACQVAGLNCLRLLSDLTAAGLQWGITKTELPDTDQDAKTVAFVDLGQADFSVQISSFQRGKMVVRGVGWDSNLGGRDFDMALFNHFCEEFKQKYKIDVRSNLKAKFRLLAGCEKLKKILSANSQAPLNIECLMDDKDVSSMVKREQFELLIEPLLQRLENPIKRAIESSGLKSIDEIDCVELVGGSTRIPAVKQKIMELFGGKTLSTTLNQDECIAKGCAFMCAILSPTFRTREFKLEDMFGYPIKISHSEVPALKKSGSKSSSQKKSQPSGQDMLVFAAYSKAPSSKQLTFYPKPGNQFVVEAEYADPSMLTGCAAGTSSWLSKHIVCEDQGIPQQQDSNSSSTKIKVKVRLTPNGLFDVTQAQMFEEVEVEQPQKTEADESKPQEDKEQSTDADSEMADASESKPESPAPKTKIVAKDLPITCQLNRPSDKQIESMRELELNMIASDKLIIDTEERRNALEEFVYNFRSKIYEQYAEYVDEAQREKLSAILTETEDWLYGDGENATKSVYIAKLEEIQAMEQEIRDRMPKPATEQSTDDAAEDSLNTTGKNDSGMEVDKDEDANANADADAESDEKKAE